MTNKGLHKHIQVDPFNSKKKKKNVDEIHQALKGLHEKG